MACGFQTLTRKTKERLRETFDRIVSRLVEDPHVASLGKFLAERQQEIGN
jgi:hypothetical protein